MKSRAILTILAAGIAVVKVGESDGGIIKTLSKIKVYPVMNFRLCGRIL
ncbi:MAG: hypothetical protein LUC49_04790 [Prevotella sp.]|nr:hypothetical protein [Prevotella sp.]